MQMGGHIAQAGKVDFVRPQHLAQQGFDLQDGGQQVIAVHGRQVGHFFDVGVPNHPTKAGVIWFVHQHNAELGIAVEQFAALRGAQLAGCGGHRHGYSPFSIIQ